MRKILILFLLLTFSNAFAGLIINPARSEVIIEKNSAHDSSYTVTNGFDKPVKVEISIKNWNNSRENRDIPVNSWLFVPYSCVYLEPGEAKKIDYTVKSGNLSGSLSAMISFTVKSPDYEGINLMTSVPVYMTIDGTQNISFDIEKIEVKKENNNIAVNFTVKNEGNVHLRLNGGMKIIKGKNIVSERMINGLSPVYPDLTRKFSELIDAVPKGVYTLNISLNALGKTVEKSIRMRVNKYGDAAL